MKVGIVGLGLIGGSFSRAIKEATDHVVLGYDISEAVIKKAQLLEVIDGELTDENIPECDIIITAIYPEDTLKFIREKAHLFSKETVVMDTCGVKRAICDEAWEIADKYGFTFVGGHPMDGAAKIGFDNSKKGMFKNASMILVPGRNLDIYVIEKLKKVLDAMGFGNYEIASKEKHDRIIAYTSQLAHVVSSAYICSETSREHRGFSAGSYKDMTRVAYLNEKMWTELFFDNKDFLIDEIDGLIDRLTAFSDSLKNDDRDKMFEMLAKGRKRKEEVK